jgi:chromosome segregation ATPase
MAYEYNFYKNRYAWHERRRDWYNQQWQKVVDSGLLRPHETYKFIQNPESDFQHEREEQAASRALELAEAAVASAQQAISDPLRRSVSASRRIATAKAKLESARQSFDVVKKRNDLISYFSQSTQNYQEARRYAERWMRLLQWIRQQIPVIEAELEQGKVSSPDAVRESAVVHHDQTEDPVEEMGTVAKRGTPLCQRETLGLDTKHESAVTTV